ncbi:hypothetical protein HF313_15945 [Massilia atriviolacea]|uniref:Uncharacterized protein n=1 Tax=Massilia atriviolacea TaxID=2495579 RepID=A0A430HEF6_9BURK|nr:hypothetical protein [Massilia atriviolacea]RSZ55905.1 hypothetical protein EJB06_27245 [Massilia atriviolacea]
MRQTVFFLAALLGVGGVQAASGVSAGGVVLLQPERVIEARVSVDRLAPYLKLVDASARRALAKADAVPASSGFLVVAIRPGAQSMAWLDFTPPLPKTLANALLAGTQAVPVPAVKGGTVVTAIKYGMGGASAPTQPTPAPAEWTTAARAAGQPLDIGELVDRLWK